MGVSIRGGGTVAGPADPNFLGAYTDLATLNTGHPSPAIGNYATIAGVRHDWDSVLSIWRTSAVNSYRDISTSGPLSITDDTVIVDASAGPVTLTLPSSAQGSTGAETLIKIRKADGSSNPVIVVAGSGDTVEVINSVPPAFGASTSWALPASYAFVLSRSSALWRLHT